MTKNTLSSNIRSADIHVFRTDLRNVLESTTQSDSADPLSVDNTCFRHDILFSQSVRNIGVFVDEKLSVYVHIKHLCRSLFCQLRRLDKIPPFLSTDAANKLAVSFILTRLDYCNSLLAGLPDNKLNKLFSAYKIMPPE